LAAVVLSASPAGATPSSTPATPTNKADAIAQYQALATQQEKLQEQMLATQNDLTAKQGVLNKAKDALKKAHVDSATAAKQVEQFRGQVDDLSAAAYQGARFSQVSAIFNGSSAQDYLDRASALSVLSSNNDDVLKSMLQATNLAQTAEAAAAAATQTAQDATDAANKLLQQILQQKKDVDAQKGVVQAALDALSAAERQALGGSGLDPGTVIASDPQIQKVIDFALSQRGKPYVWGAIGMPSYDCSGLTMRSFEQIGISLPHSSRAQATMGSPVAEANIQPGDIVYYGSPVHHVGIALGNGLMVDAPTEGENVGVHKFNSDYAGARRITSSNS
jgi:cell wall-associated NlpC family hydrolase